MKGPRRKAERERDLVLVSELLLKGWTTYAIAEHLSTLFYSDKGGISQRSIGYDKKQLEERWLALQMDILSYAKARELARIDAIEKEAWLAWEDSKPAPEVTETSPVAKRKNTGNHQYLQTIRWCVEQRRKILGLDTPDEINIKANVELYSLQDVVIAIEQEETRRERKKLEREDERVWQEREVSEITTPAIVPDFFGESALIPLEGDL